METKCKFNEKTVTEAWSFFDIKFTFPLLFCSLNSSTKRIDVQRLDHDGIILWVLIKLWVDGQNSSRISKLHNSKSIGNLLDKDNPEKKV